MVCELQSLRYLTATVSFSVSLRGLSIFNLIHKIRFGFHALVNGRRQSYTLVNGRGQSWTIVDDSGQL